jgi:hypothetical protein
MNKLKLLEQNIVKCKIVPKFEKKIMFVEYILTNFMLFLRGNFKNVTIDLAMHSHSAPISVCSAF